MPGTSPDADPASQALARPPRRLGAVAPSLRAGSALKNSSNLFLISRAAAGVRGTELGGGRVEAHGAANAAGAARHDSAYFEGRAGIYGDHPIRSPD